MSKKAMRRSPTSRNERRAAIAAKHEVPLYAVAFNCGHRSWQSLHNTTGGLAWCATCRGYVGVVVTRRQCR